MSLREFVSLFTKVAGQQPASLLKRCFFCNYFSSILWVHFQNFSEYLFLGHTSEWLLPVCGKCTGRFCFLGESILHHFLFWIFYYFKLGMASLSILLNILFLFVFNFKTQNSPYTLIYHSQTDFLKRFMFCYIILIVLIALRQKYWLRLRTLILSQIMLKEFRTLLKHLKFLIF